MRRIGIILVFCALWAMDGTAASRTTANNTPTIRTGTQTQRVRTQTTTSRSATRAGTTTPQVRSTTRSATKTTSQQNNSRSVSGRSTNTPTRSARTGIVARAATDTRTGTEYEQCKTTYFACMDQFCQLKNDDYRRCSCSNRITSLQTARDNLVQAGEQLTAFNENLDIVGKTAAQATAMNTASDGELALARDKSASQALLNAIMNSIRGTDSRVENNTLSDLNSIDLSFDTANSFGTANVGQTIASYNGQALYSAVYPQCRTAVKSVCNDASLQRAINAYLMAIEQDCNTVQTAITNKQKETHAAIRESSAMLDMARAENHQAHNSDNIATCLANVETAILSDEVCGTNYHKCLDNGEYIDVSTGQPIAGVIDFYKLGTMLSFNSGRGNADQKLAQNPNNKTFVTNFEKRVKQFAAPALDKCYDDADTVWADYLNKALLDIYYAQQSKVEEIKQGCFDFVSACYMNGSTAMTNAMQGLVAAQTTTLNPNVLKLNQSLCADYIASCNNMFDGNIVQDYITNRHDTDSLTACRAVVKQCFDNYGGLNYENFYNPSSGLFAEGAAPDWFSLYDCNQMTCPTTNSVVPENPVYKSECAKQLATIEACNTPQMIQDAFGGFDYYSNGTSYTKYASYNSINQKQNRLLRPSGIATEIYNQIIDILQTGCANLDGSFMNVQNLALSQNDYSSESFCTATFEASDRYSYLYTDYSIGKTLNTVIRTFNTIMISAGSTGSSGTSVSGGNGTTISLNPGDNGVAGIVPNIIKWGSVENTKHENMCPRDYNTTVDVQSWGACLCWENGGRRSNNGTSTRCVATFPAKPLIHYNKECATLDDNNNGSCTKYSSVEQITTYGLNNTCISDTPYITSQSDDSGITYMFTKWPQSGNTIPTDQDWCNATVNNNNQVCPFGVQLESSGECQECPKDWAISDIPNGICCPNNYQYLSSPNICCPNSYNTYDSNSKCTNGTDSVDGITPQKTSSKLMGDNFPNG